MLEIRDLYKIYRSKGGVETRALDGVTVTFPEKGMVFLLGKSGSGKSTLLNVCGGLDTPDSGEIIVRGRSSKSFSGSDFDSYRNTFIGFIFQEYNILNEFSVEDNLALALELQGKPKDKEKIAELLEQVDMTGFAKRKPNTLSGGQKQRIAIARALIKDPKIIMADEPTGALDSATGKQVFDTLKKLSETRLVIVVSHDREFAEIYGDRIIELKDGKIISDVSKERVASESLSENVSVIAGNTLSVRNGRKLNGNELKKIEEFLLSSDGDAIITVGERNVANFKEISRIGSDDSSERFSDTDGDKIETRAYTKEESSFVRSRLPLKKAAKMGASSLKVKPFRLFLTILLSVAAFMMFGVTSTLMTYNERNVVIESFTGSTYTDILLAKKYDSVYSSYENDKLKYSYVDSNKTVMTKADIEELKKTFGDGIRPFYSFSQYDTSVSVGNVSAGQDPVKTMTDFSLSGFVPVSGGGLNTSVGNLPEKNDEIAISAFYASVLLKNSIYQVKSDGSTDGRKEVEPKPQKAEDLIGKQLSLRINGYNLAVKITGVFDAGEIPDEYADYASAEKIAAWSDLKLMDFMNYTRETMQKAAVVSSGFYAYAKEKTNYSYSQIDDYEKYFKNGKYYHADLGEKGSVGYSSYAVYKNGEENVLPVYFFESGKTAISGDEIIVKANETFIYDFFPEERKSEWIAEREAEGFGTKYENAAASRDNYWELYSESCKDPDKKAAYEEAERKLEERRAYLDENGSDYWSDEEYRRLSDERDAAWADYSNSFSDANGNEEYRRKYEYYGILADAYYAVYKAEPFISRVASYITYASGKDVSEATDSIKNELLSVLGKFWLDYADRSQFTLSLYADDGSYNSVTVVGFYLDPNAQGGYYGTGIYVSEEKYDDYRYSGTWRSERTTKYKFPEADEYYNGAFVPYAGGHSENLEKALDIMAVKADDDSYYVISNTLYEKITRISNTVSNMQKVFLYVGLAIAAFAALLLFNFISVSITDKMHEIGVLRAVGARGVDVFKIFFSESFIISLICMVLSLAGTVVLLIYLNAEVTKALSFSMRLLVFGPASFGMMVAVAFAVAILGTFIPVFRISRKKPVDSMRAL